MLSIRSYLATSIGKKQIVALTGFLLVLFVIFHLAENLLIFNGPNFYNTNNIGAVMSSISKPVLYLLEIGLLLIFSVHIFMTARLVIENRRARRKRYEIDPSTPLLVKLMPLTGTLLFIFLIVHLLDFRFQEHHGLNSIVNGINLGLYGLIFNYFQHPLRIFVYLVGMVVLGCHLSHAIQSMVQTYGSHNVKYIPAIKTMSMGIGIFVAIGFSLIPVLLYFGFTPGLSR